MSTSETLNYCIFHLSEIYAFT